MTIKEVTITAPSGLHARPATLLVKNASAFKSDITLEFGEKKANVKSLIGVLSLAIPTGATVKVIATGEDEETACEKIAELIATIEE